MPIAKRIVNWQFNCMFCISTPTLKAGKPCLVPLARFSANRFLLPWLTWAPTRTSPCITGTSTTYSLKLVISTGSGVAVHGVFVLSSRSMTVRSRFWKLCFARCSRLFSILPMHSALSVLSAEPSLTPPVDSVLKCSFHAYVITFIIPCLLGSPCSVTTTVFFCFEACQHALSACQFLVRGTHYHWIISLC